MIYVFTAVHDRYKITEKFVDQLLRQTYKDIKLVLVDDGCTDGTADIAAEHEPSLPERAFKNPRNRHHSR